MRTKLRSRNAMVVIKNIFKEKKSFRRVIPSNGWHLLIKLACSTTKLYLPTSEQSFTHRWRTLFKVLATSNKLMMPNITKAHLSPSTIAPIRLKILVFLILLSWFSARIKIATHRTIFWQLLQLQRLIEPTIFCFSVTSRHSSKSGESALWVCR